MAIVAHIRFSRSWFLFLALLGAHLAHGQTPAENRIKSQLAAADTLVGDAKVSAYLNVAIQYVDELYNGDSALVYCRKAIALTKGRDEAARRRLEANTYQYMALAFRNISMLDSALYYALQRKNYYSEISVFNTYSELNKLKVKYKLASSHEGVAHVYKAMDDGDKALESYLTGIKLIDELGATDFRERVSPLSYNMSSFYYNFAVFYFGNNELMKSIQMAQTAIDESKLIPNANHNTVRLQVFMIRIHNQTEDYEQAIDLGQAILETKKLGLDKILEMELYQELSKGYRGMNQLDSAIIHGETALELSESGDNNQILAENHQYLAGLYRDAGDFGKAFDHFVKFHDYYVVGLTNYEEREIGRLEGGLAFEDELNKTRIENARKLERQQSRNLTLSIIGVALLIMFLILSWNFRLIKRSRRLKEEQTQKLRDLDEAKSRFFANISHELRTPLTLILGNLKEILKRDNQMDLGEMRESLNISRQNGQRMLTLTEEILDLSKLESGQLKIKEKAVPFQLWIKRLMGGYQSFVEQKQVKLILNFDLPDDIVLNIDEDKFDKIINNLLSNAVKYTDPNGKIEIEVNHSDIAGDEDDLWHIQFKISDNGRGIHQDDLPRIFNRYYQSDQDGVVIEGGTGIGLALARELTELLGGNLSVESQWGIGSTFIFSFSARRASPESVEETITVPLQNMNGIDPEFQEDEDEPTPMSKGNKRKKILLVEDHPEMRAFLKQILDSDYGISEAIDGVHALEVLKEHRVDLIISDVMMPRLDGFGLLKRVREESAWKDLPIMMLTARAANEDKVEAFNIGVDDYLTKPFEATELMARIKNLITNRERRIDYAENTNDVPDQTELSAFDQEFVKKAEEVVFIEMKNNQFGIMDMAEALNVSQRQLTRKMQQTTGLSPLHFIREVKLQTARKLLENREKETVAEVMYAVGILSTGYFAKIYYNRFGKQPSAYFQH